MKLLLLLEREERWLSIARLVGRELVQKSAEHGCWLVECGNMPYMEA